MLGHYPYRKLKGLDFFFPYMGKDGLDPRRRHLQARRVFAEMLVNDSQPEDVCLIKETGMSRGIKTWKVEIP